MKFCMYCGTQIPDGEKMCDNCKVARNVAPAPVVPPVVEAPVVPPVVEAPVAPPVVEAPVAPPVEETPVVPPVVEAPVVETPVVPPVVEAPVAPTYVPPVAPVATAAPKKKKKSKAPLIVLLCLLGVLLIGAATVGVLIFTHVICLNHEWEDATCETPKTCTYCGETKGKKADHEWKDATCEDPKTCSECDETEGEALGHQWVEATNDSPKTCSVCKKTEGEPAGTSTATVKPKTDAEFAAAEAEIRYAISLMLDRNFIAQGGLTPANTFVADGMADFGGGNFKENANGGAGYYSVDATNYTANYEKAISILKKYYDFKGGKIVGFPTLTYVYNTGDAHKAIAEYMQAVVANVGITLKLENQEWNTFLNTRKDGQYSIARNGWVADYTDPICFLEMWTSGSGNNDVQFGKGDHADLKAYSIDLTKFGGPKVDNGTWAETYDVLIAEIKQCTDSAKRYEMMHIAEDMLMATGCLTPLYYYTDLYMVSSRVEGFYSTPLGYKFFQNTTVDGKGDSLPVCLASEPDTIDPALNSAVDGATMLCHLFSGLAKWTQNADGTLSVVADCATKLPAGVKNADGTVTYTYTLKDGLKWSDGVALTAKDFEFAWKRAASVELSADYGYMFDVVKGYGTGNKDDLAVKAIDDKTLQVTLINDVAYWNELLAFPTYFPVREDVVADEGWATEADTYIGNGPYTMTGWEHNAVITMTKNENYHDADSVTMNELKFYLSDDANNMLNNYKSGDWLLIDDVPSNEIANLKTQYPNEFVIAGQIGTYYVCWNVNEPLLKR